MLKTTPIQAIRLALAYATFKDDSLAAKVTGLLNALGDDLDEMQTRFNIEDFSSDTAEAMKEVTDRLTSILSPEKPDDTDEV